MPEAPSFANFNTSHYNTLHRRVFLALPGYRGKMAAKGRWLGGFAGGLEIGEESVMFEKYMILTQEFKNVREGASITGFQVKVRLPHYRGIWLSTIHHLELKVDDENFAREKIAFAIGGQRFSMEELENAVKVRWFFGDPATLIVAKPGGLSAGMHTVYYAIGWRHSYVPESDPENIYGFPPGVAAMLDAPTAVSKRMTLVI